MRLIISLVLCFVDHDNSDVESKLCSQFPIFYFIFHLFKVKFGYGCCICLRGDDNKNVVFLGVIIKFHVLRPEKKNCDVCSGAKSKSTGDVKIGVVVATI